MSTGAGNPRRALPAPSTPPLHFGADAAATLAVYRHALWARAAAYLREPEADDLLEQRRYIKIERPATASCAGAGPNACAVFVTAWP